LSIEGVYEPERDPGRDGVRLTLVSRSLKLEGGPLETGGLLARPTEPWNTDTCCALARSACSGVCARRALALNVLVVGLSAPVRLKFDIEDPGLDGV